MGTTVARARSDCWTFFSSVSALHRTTPVLARAHPMWLPSDTSHWLFRKKLRVVNKRWDHPSLPYGLQGYQSPGGSLRNPPTLLTLSWELTQGSGRCKVGVRISTFLSHFWTQSRDSEAAGTGQHHLRDRYNYHKGQWQSRKSSELFLWL